jgi:hypothetical protein
VLEGQPRRVFQLLCGRGENRPFCGGKQPARVADDHENEGRVAALRKISRPLLCISIPERLCPERGNSPLRRYSFVFV